jgi:hypothetical protein
MNRPSTHLSWKELGCRDGTPYPLEWRATRGRDLGIVFERIRALNGKPITVGSAYRTPSYNRKVGGAKASQHIQGRALDLYPPKGVSIAAFQHQVRKLADQMVREGNDLIGGIGYYPTFVHVDIRGGVGSPLIVWWGNRPVAEVTGA